MVFKDLRKMIGSLAVIFGGLFKHRHRFEILVVKERPGDEYDYMCRCGERESEEGGWRKSPMILPEQDK